MNRAKLHAFAIEAAQYSTGHFSRQLPVTEFAMDARGRPDCAVFDFTNLYSARNACQVYLAIILKNSAYVGMYLIVCLITIIRSRLGVVFNYCLLVWATVCSSLFGQKELGKLDLYSPLFLIALI